jgi:hypothetical protein
MSTNCLPMKEVHQAEEALNAIPKERLVSAILNIVMFLLDREQIVELHEYLSDLLPRKRLTDNEISEIRAEIGPYHSKPIIMNLLFTLRLEMEKMCEAVMKEKPDATQRGLDSNFYRKTNIST